MCPTGSSCILLPNSREKAELLPIVSSGGVIYAEACRIQTPIGVLDGLHYTGAPYILPGFMFDELRAISVVSSGGNTFCLEWHEGLPVINFNAKVAGLKVFYAQAVRPTTKVNRREIRVKALVNYATHQNCGCSWCKKAKLTYPARKKKKVSASSIPGEVINADLCTGWPKSRESETSFLAQYDTATRIYGFQALTSKNSPKLLGAVASFANIMSRIRVLCNIVLQGSWVFHCDLGSEFVSNALLDVIAINGGVLEYAPQGRHVANAEAAIKVLANGIRVTLAAGGLPLIYWSYAGMAFTHNMNINSPQYLAYCRDRNSPTTEGIFGRLCYTKIDRRKLGESKEETLDNDGAPVIHSDFATKAELKGVPCAFLCYCPTVLRRGAYVAFAREDGGIGVTTVDVGSNHEGLIFEPDREGVPVFMFERVTRNMKDFYVNRRVADIAGSGFLGWTQEQKEAWIRDNPIHAALVEPASTCPACRGRRRRHNMDPSCMYHGIPARGDWRAEYRRRMIDGRETSEEIAADLRLRVAHQLAAAAAIVVAPSVTPSIASMHKMDGKGISTGFERKRLPSNEASSTSRVGNLTALFEVAATKHREKQKENNVIKTNKKIKNDKELNKNTPDTEPVRRPIVTPLPVPRPISDQEYCQGPPDPVPEATGPTDRKQPFVRSKLLSFATLTAAACIAVCSLKSCFTMAVPEELRNEIANTHLTVDFDEESLVREACSDYRAALVTRKMFAGEKSSQKGVDAHQDEMSKLGPWDPKLQKGHGMYDMPIETRDVKDPLATTCGIAMLSHVKNAERAPEKQTFKGRAVVLGDQLRYLLNWGEPVKPWWDEMSSEVAALEEIRTLDAFAVLNGFEIETVDLEAAYMQAIWPKGRPRHYLKIPVALIKLMPERIRDKALAMDNPLFEMFKAGYGHPASGHIWGEKLSKFLFKTGWVSATETNSRCLFRRGKCMLATYVDDLKVTGPQEDLDSFWAELGEAFTFKAEQETCTEFLGMQYRRDKNKSLFVSQTDYIKDTVKEFEKLWGYAAKPSKIPGSDTLRTVDPELMASTPERRVQVMVGRLLWVSRCTRPEIAQMVSALGTRVARWDHECERQLAMLCGYLQSTATLELQFKWDKNVPASSAVFKIHSDSDWLAPRSQSSFFSCVESSESEFCMLPIHWGSKKQPITADSSTSAEIVASIYSLKGGFPALACLRDTLVASGLVPEVQGAQIRLLLDNTGAILHITKSPSDSVYFHNKAINVRHGLIRDIFGLGIIAVDKVPTEENRGDVGTKVFSAGIMQDKLKLVGLTDVTGAIWAPAARAVEWRRNNADKNAPSKANHVALCALLRRNYHPPRRSLYSD